MARWSLGSQWLCCAGGLGCVRGAVGAPAGATAAPPGPPAGPQVAPTSLEQVFSQDLAA